MISLLASVRNLEEALEAAEAGADLIDLKEPLAGALGGLSPTDITRIAAEIRSRWPRRLISATIGDFEPADHDARCAQATAVAGCGVDYVKVGIEPGENAGRALSSLADLGLPALVIVFLADRGVDLPLAEAAAAMGFAGLMVDTADKSAGSLLRHADTNALGSLVAIARRHGCLSGLAGSLARDDVPLLRRLQPDFAGFRGALCDGDRRGRLDATKVRALRDALRMTAPQPYVASSIRIRGSSSLPSSSIE